MILSVPLEVCSFAAYAGRYAARETFWQWFGIVEDTFGVNVEELFQH